MNKKIMSTLTLLSVALIASLAMLPVANVNATDSNEYSGTALSSNMNIQLNEEVSKLIVQNYREYYPNSTLSAEEIYEIAINDLLNSTPSIIPFGGVTKSHAINGGERIYLSALTLGVVVGGGSIVAAVATAGASIAVTAVIAAVFAVSGIVVSEYLSTGIVFDFMYYKNHYLGGVKIMIPITPRIENAHAQ